MEIKNNIPGISIILLIVSAIVLIIYSLTMNSDNPEWIISISLSFITLSALIVSHESLKELRDERAANIIMWMDIDERDNVYVYCENAGQRSAKNLYFTIEGKTDLNSPDAIPFFNKKHETVPPRMKWSFLITILHTEDGKLIESQREICKITAKYRDALYDKNEKSIDLIVDLSCYEKVKRW